MVNAHSANLSSRDLFHHIWNKLSPLGSVDGDHFHNYQVPVHFLLSHTVLGVVPLENDWKMEFPIHIQSCKLLFLSSPFSIPWSHWTAVGSWFPIFHIQPCPVCLPLTSPCPALELTYKLQTSSSQWRVSCAASQFYKVLRAVHLKSW